MRRAMKKERSTTRKYDTVVTPIKESYESNISENLSFMSASTLTMGSEWNAENSVTTLNSIGTAVTPSPRPRYSSFRRSHNSHNNVTPGSKVSGFSSSSDTTYDFPKYNNYSLNESYSGAFNPMMTYPLSTRQVSPIQSSVEEDDNYSFSSKTSSCSSSILDDGIERFIHQKTFQSDSSVYSSVKSYTHGSNRSSKSRNKRLPGDRTIGSLSYCTSSHNKSFFSPETSKVFILLIKPATKQFELIEVSFHSRKGTLGDILYLIPSSSTEEALGYQKHCGLCRPTDGIEMTNRSALAGNLNKSNSYKILNGEILVAIPQGCTGAQCRKLSRPILNHPALTKLLKRQDPLMSRRGSKYSKREHRHKNFDANSIGSKPSHHILAAPSDEKMHFEIDMDSIRSSSPDELDEHKSVKSSTSYFSAFLENERFYSELHERCDEKTVISIGHSLDKVASNVEKSFCNAIGAMNDAVNKTFTPEDYTRTIVKRKKNNKNGGFSAGNRPDPVSSLKVFCAFISVLITRYAFKPQSNTSSMGASDGFLCCAIFGALIAYQKQFETENVKRISGS